VDLASFKARRPKVATGVGKPLVQNDIPQPPKSCHDGLEGTEIDLIGTAILLKSAENMINRICHERTDVPVRIMGK
jgi:hypothetical protein